MKDSQQLLYVEEEILKYIKANNERFSTCLSWRQNQL